MHAGHHFNPITELGYKTSAHTVQLHSLCENPQRDSDGIYCRTGRKIWAALPLGK
jgi:hypothetical protein